MRKYIALVVCILLLLGLFFFYSKTFLFVKEWSKFRKGPVVSVKNITRYEQIGVIRGGKLSKKIKIKYSYDINGESFTSDRVSIAGNDPFSFTDPEMISKIEGFKDKRNYLSCFVSINDPNKAVLDKGLSKKLLVIFIVSSFAITFIFYKATKAYNYERIQSR